MSTPATTIQELLDKLQQSSTKSVSQNIIQAQYGDAYRQTAKFGINAERDMWNIVLTGLVQSERDLFWNTYNTVGTYDTISWQAPNDASAKKWLIKGNVSETSISNLFNLNFTLEQEYRVGA